MYQGKLVQYGTPQELWERPVNAFVADFLASSLLLDVTLDQDSIVVDGTAWRIPLADLTHVRDTRSPQMILRPDSCEIVSAASLPAGTGASDLPDGIVRASVSSAEYVGGIVQVTVALADAQFTVRTAQAAEIGHDVLLKVRPGRASLLGIHA